MGPHGQSGAKQNPPELGRDLKPRPFFALRPPGHFINNL